jgi:hypothetical protein
MPEAPSSVALVIGSDAADLAGIRQQFEEQVAFFRAKLNLPSARWDDIKKAAHDRAFIVAGAQQADLLNDLRAAVDKAITGGSIGAFRKDFFAAVAKSGWTGWTGEGTKAGEAWRTRVIYQTNVATSYAAGRWQQLNDPELLKVCPFWRYIHSDNVMSPRPLHKAWGDSGLTLPADHPFWKTHFPPNGWGCHCRILAVSAPKPGDATQPPEGWDTVLEKTDAPAGIDKGWDYAPGANADTPLQRLIDNKLINLDAPIGGAMWKALNPVLLAEKVKAFPDFVVTTLSAPVRGKTFVAGALKPAWIAAATKANMTPLTAEVVVRDADIWHTFRDAKKGALNLDWYKSLPTLLDQPGAVVLDTTHANEPAFLLFFDSGNSAEKLVVRINYRVKKLGTANVVETGRKVDLSGVRAMIGHGYELIEGSL